MPPTLTPTYRVESRELRPVAARIISYGSSSKIAGHATLYLLRVTRGGHEWYVARRYSEFRALHEDLKGSLGRVHGRLPQSAQGCGHCRELARTFPSMQFPSRFRLRSGFAAAKEKIESERMPQLNAFLQRLIETTQGLLADEDDDCDVYGEDADPTHDRCEALGAIGEFLMLDEHTDSTEDTVARKQTQTPTTTTIDQLSVQIPGDVTNANNQLETPTPTPSATPTPPRRPRLMSGNSVTFRVQDLDVLHRPTSPLSTWAPPTALVSVDSMVMLSTSSPNVLDERELDELFLADYGPPADDAVVHRQASIADDMAARNVLHRTESLRMSRRI